jgi:hypothetical protein
MTSPLNILLPVLIALAVASRGICPEPDHIFDIGDETG